VTEPRAPDCRDDRRAGAVRRRPDLTVGIRAIGVVHGEARSVGTPVEDGRGRKGDRRDDAVAEPLSAGREGAVDAVTAAVVTPAGEAAEVAIEPTAVIDQSPSVTMSSVYVPAGRIVAPEPSVVCPTSPYAFERSTLSMEKLVPSERE
jgi:hypothetical protein